MENKEKIISAATQLFMRYGVRSVSMDDIAHNLSMSKKTLYQYFKDKDDIVTTAFRQHMDEEIAEYEAIHRDASDPIDEMTRVAQCMRKDFKDINPSLLFDIRKYHPRAWEIWVAFRNDHIYGTLTDSLKRGMEMGYFRKDIDVEVMARLRLEQVEMAFNTELFPPSQFELPHIQVQFFENFLRGILTRKGLELFDQYNELNEQQQS